MGQTFDTLKQVSEIWPLLTFMGVSILGYLNMRYAITTLKRDMHEKERDIKGVSQKINSATIHFSDEFKNVRREIGNNHLEVSKTLSRIEGRLFKENSPS